MYVEAEAGMANFELSTKTDFSQLNIYEFDSRTSLARCRLCNLMWYSFVSGLSTRILRFSTQIKLTITICLKHCWNYGEYITIVRRKFK